MSGYYPPPPGAAGVIPSSSHVCSPDPDPVPAVSSAANKLSPPPQAAPAPTPPANSSTPQQYPPPPQLSQYPPPPQQPQAQYPLLRLSNSTPLLLNRSISLLNTPPPPPPQQSPTQQQQQYPPPPQPQAFQHGALPSHVRTASVATAGSPAPQPPFSPPPAYPGQPNDNSYPDEKKMLQQQEQAQQQAEQQQQQQQQQQAQQAQQPQMQQPAPQLPAPGQVTPAATLPPAQPAATLTQQPQFVGATSTYVDDVGTFNGGSYRISHRDSNTVLTIQLAVGCPINAKPGAMLAMSPSVQLKGHYKITVKKFLAGGDMGTSTFTGPGEVLFAPHMLGDITSLRLNGGNEAWSVSSDAYLASTQYIVKDYKRQGLSKAIFSGEGLWVYKITGTGLVWLTSFGAIIRKDLAEGEQYIVDNGHLVAWNTKYTIERVASGGLISGMAAGEGLVCKFHGPGTVFIQTRNAKSFAAYIQGQQPAA
ncbi:uncharacterized protein CTHT_0051310 [Thermochaetoides thermophila DSM 1495]|uniref:Altered inheritance of mitochondria protein 24, mitochondrial n=1 Tax=Chaetomium thermophilum (strain DSM 1495 / CBS 144.50 / IMI 039719) TaxID=759272 RepID=G0SDC7_CHATD|nr:hypothetical protein CTHT_0051310 [Thermochaetoides thermophila DSM 1495]EGS18528.1 hypothetical protein CTHT_0051310 [Thermochaetoides thermophila DSM 1495]